MLGLAQPLVEGGKTNYLPRIDRQICFNVGFTNDWEDSAAVLYVRLNGEGVFNPTSLTPLGSGESVESGVAYNFVRCTFDPYAFDRLDSLEYFFMFDPNDADFDPAYVGLSEDGSSSAVYEKEDDAADHPFTYTFPFHDQLWFTRYDTSADPAIAVVFDAGEFTSPPEVEELALEILVGNLVTNAWSNYPVAFYDRVIVRDGSEDEKGTYYYISFDRPESAPAFFRVVPARQKQ